MYFRIEGWWFCTFALSGRGNAPNPYPTPRVPLRSALGCGNHWAFSPPDTIVP